MANGDPPNPNMKEISDGLFCFMNENRVCGPGCMAFLNPVPPGQDYADQQWANCMLLVNAHRTGKHLAIITQVVERGEKRTRDQVADAARGSQPVPPTPLVPR